MDYDKWEDVLIQWINCLKLTDPIHDLESLRNGEFFSKLLLVLSPTYASITCNNCLPTSLDLIKAQYSNYILDEDDLTDLHSLSVDNIITICSLLLHFACVIERKDSLIVPLCKKLPSNVQINIKNFLEKVNSKITNFHFKKIIDEMNESNVSSTAYQWMPVGDSPLIGTSPLQDFLRSPSMKSTRLEKDREIKKLKSELENERFEKADLQEELKEHKEEIKKLGNQIKDKAAQISRLRSELYALENKTPPHNMKTASLDIERQLKIEIQTLERYVDQLQTKHDDLQDENMDISDKLKNSTKDLKMWQLTAQSLELNNKELSEKYSKQELELENLKVQCAELSGILEEIRSSNEANESSILFSPTKSKRISMNDNGILFEDLAHTIVDVQLKDAQKENNELKSLLKESSDKENLLQIQLENTKENYEDLCKKFTNLEDTRNILLQKITELTQAYEEMERLKCQTEKVVDQLSIDNLEKDSVVSSLQSDLESSTSLCNQHKSMSESLKSELHDIKSQLKDCQYLVVQKDNLYENLQKEADLLQVKYRESVDKFNKTNFDLENVKENYDQFKRNLEKSLINLENIVCGYNEMKFDDNLLDNIAIKIQTDKISMSKEIEDLKRSVNDYEGLVDVFKREITNLKDEEIINLEEKQKLKKLINVTQISMEKLQETINEQNIEINQKTEKIVELNSIIEELTKLEYVIQNKQSKITDLEAVVKEKETEVARGILEVCNLKETVQKMKDSEILLNEDLTNKAEEIRQLQDKNSILDQHLVDFEVKMDKVISEHVQEMMQQEKICLEKIYMSNLQIQDCSVKIEELETDLRLTTQNLNLKSTELIDLQNATRLMEENNAKVTENLREKIDITENTIKKLEIELSIVTNERENLQSDVNNLNRDHNKLISEKENLSDDAKDLKLKIKSAFENLCNAEEACAQKDTIISQTNKELLNMKLDVESKRQEYKQLQEHVEKLSVEASSYKFCIDTLETKNSDFENKIAKLEKELCVLKNLKECLENKNLELSNHTNDILSKLALKEEELSKITQELSNQKETSESALKDACDMYEQANKTIINLENERANIIDKNNKEITSLKEEINKLNDKIFELNAKEIDYIHELQVVKAELSVSFEKYTQNFDEQHELKAEYEAQIKNLTENLHEVVAKYNRLENNHQSNIFELEAMSASLERSKVEKVALEIKIIDQKNEYDREIEETKEQFKIDMKQLTEKHVQLEQTLFKAKSDLEQQIGIKFRLENDVKKLIIKVNDVDMEKVELLYKIENLESIKSKLENDYKQLKLSYDEYILASETNLKQREDELQNSINHIESAKQQLEEEIKTLQGEILDLKSENQKLQKQIEDDQERYEKGLNELQNKIEQHEWTNARIIEEQCNLRQKMLNYQNENEISNKTSLEQADMVSKLKSAYDILQTGKERVELDLRNNQEQLRTLHNDYLAKEMETDAKLTQNEVNTNKLNEDLKTQTTLLKSKVEELSNLNEKLLDLQRVNEAMKAEIQTLENTLAESNDSREMILNKIDEENLQAINEMSREFNILKTQYGEISEEVVSLRNGRLELINKIEYSTKNMSDLQKVIEGKETLIEELKGKLRESEQARFENETVIKEFSEELTDTVNKLVSVKNEKLKLDVELEEARIEIDRLKKSRDDILEVQHKIIKETEDNILRAHANAIDVKNDLLMNIENAKGETTIERNEKFKVQKLLEEEKAGVQLLEIGLLNMRNEKSKLEQVHFVLKKCISRLSEVVDLKTENFDKIDGDEVEKVMKELEENITETYRKSRELSDTVSKLQTYENESHTKLLELENERTTLNEEKMELLRAYNDLIEKNQVLLLQKAQEKEEMQKEITNWMNKYEENVYKANDTDSIKTENEVLHQTVISLKDKNVKAYNIYTEFSECSKSFKTTIDKILKDRNSLDISITELRQPMIQIQTKYLQLNRELSSKHQEQKESLELIIDDIQKQFNRYSKIAYNLAYNNVQICEKVIQGILSEKYLDWQHLLKELNIDEVSDKFEELKERAIDALEQVKSFDEILDKNELKNTKVLKENLLKTTSSSQLDSRKDEEWRKKYIALRQKLTLTENVKNNYEKKVRQLREENKKLTSEHKNLDEDASYKILLQQHIQAKEEFEKKVSELKEKYQNLQSEYVELKKQKVKATEGGIFERNEKEIQAIREAYGKLMTDNAKLELDSTTLRKLIDDKNSELAELFLVREAYEKLLEGNSKMMTEIDTLKYKRSRDKEDFVHLLKKEREDREARENKKIQQIRAEYEGKLESMKSRMLSLYKDEIDKETRKLTAEKINYDLIKLELDESKRTIEQLRMSQKFDMLGSRESLSGLSVKSECDPRDVKSLRSRSTLDSRSGSSHSGSTLRSGMHDRRYATLPRSMGIIEENNRIPINAVPPDLGQNLEMEDEGELFNNKYLADLKEGRCVMGASDDSRFSRVSELVWRNSLCPPHLKSSYPAELQFSSPTRFKEDDIKTGNIDLDDSLSTKLLPGEKSRKKDIGTTSYKKPGPPTPSKNGGRLSLQSNEMQPLRDVQDSDAKTPKRGTPGRIKAFFLGLNSNTKSNTENQASTPKPRPGARLFRKPR